jgi:integrase
MFIEHGLSEPKICHYNYDMSKNWYVHFRALDPATNKREQYRFNFDVNTYKIKAERIKQANALRQVLIDKLRAGWRPHEVIVKEYEYLLDSLQKITAIQWQSLRERTVHTYNVIINVFYDWLKIKKYDYIKCEDFTNVEALQYMDYLSNKKLLKGRTWNNHLAFMKIFFNLLLNRDIIVKNPFKRIKKQAESQSVRNMAFSEVERLQLLECLQKENLQLYYFVSFVYYCALRPKEISMLKIKDIDFGRQNIFVSADISKNKKGESIVIPNSFMPILQRMDLQSMNKDFYILGSGNVPGVEYNKQYDKLTAKLKIIIASLKINPNCTLYSFKHSGVINLYYATNHNIVEVSRHCRHSDIGITQNYLKSLGFMDNSAVRNAVF